MRPRYQCSVCSKSWSAKAKAEKHVAECVKDPATQACATCRHQIDEDRSCELGVRSADETCARFCLSWECVSWLQSPATACSHESSSGVDQTDLDDPAKLWRCHECGAVYSEATP